MCLLGPLTLRSDTDCAYIAKFLRFGHDRKLYSYTFMNFRYIAIVLATQDMDYGMHLAI